MVRRQGCRSSEPKRIIDALSSGKLVVAIMSPGHFTTGGHFIVLRGVKDGKILVADPASTKRSQQEWDLSIILNEASKRPGAGGPFWIIGRKRPLCLTAERPLTYESAPSEPSCTIPAISLPP